MLGGGVSACDGVRRDEDADAASGPRARGDAREGRGAAAGSLPDDGPSLQGASVQLFRFFEEGRAADQPSRNALRRAGEHGSPAAGGGVAVFGIVRGAGVGLQRARRPLQ